MTRKAHTAADSFTYSQFNYVQQYTYVHLRLYDTFRLCIPEIKSKRIYRRIQTIRHRFVVPCIFILMKVSCDILHIDFSSTTLGK